MSASWLEERVLLTNVATGNNTRPTDEGSADVGDDGAVQVGHDHDIELLRLGDELHGAGAVNI